MVDEKKKELDERKENLKKMELEKSIKQQKEVLQVPQSDIRDIKKELKEIKRILNWTSKFTSLCVVGGVGIAVGSVIMAISVTSSASSLELGGLLLGLVIFLAGMFMIMGADYARKNLEKRDMEMSNMRHIIEPWHKNKWLFYSFLLMVFGIFILIVLFYLSL